MQPPSLQDAFLDLIYFSKHRKELVQFFICSRQLLKAWTLLEIVVIFLHCLKHSVLDLFPICLIFAYMK